MLKFKANDTWETGCLNFCIYIFAKITWPLMERRYM